jgi:hypothetical protein
MFRIGIALMLCVAVVVPAAVGQCTSTLCAEVRDDLAAEWKNIEVPVPQAGPGTASASQTNPVESRAALLLCLDALRLFAGTGTSDRTTATGNALKAIQAGAPPDPANAYGLAVKDGIDLLTVLETAVKGGVDPNDASLQKVSLAEADHKIAALYKTNKADLEMVYEEHCEKACSNPARALYLLLRIPANTVETYTAQEIDWTKAKSEAASAQTNFDAAAKAMGDFATGLSSSGTEISEALKKATDNVSSAAKQIMTASNAAGQAEMELKNAHDGAGRAGMKLTPAQAEANNAKDDLEKATNQSKSAAKAKLKDAAKDLSEAVKFIDSAGAHLTGAGTDAGMAATELMTANIAVGNATMKLKDAESARMTAAEDLMKATMAIGTAVKALTQATANASKVADGLKTQASLLQTARNTESDKALAVLNDKNPAQIAAQDMELYRTCFNFGYINLFKLVKEHF